MNRNFFRKISVMAVASLALLAIVQCVWTIKMYTEQKEDFVRRVESAAYKSIYKAFRMDAIPGLQATNMININIDEFALYFTPNLLELDISQPYVAEILSGNGKVLMSCGNNEVLGEKIYTSNIPIDDDAMFYLRVTISLPYKAFWGKMWGLLASSALIVVLLSGVLFYLVRTMFRQRTLEQMRQDFTHNITHELKTPISVAIAATDALRNFSAEADPQRRSRYLQIIETQLEQLSAMVQRILQVSVEGKEEKICKENMLLFPTIEEIVQDMLFTHSTANTTSTGSTTCDICPTARSETGNPPTKSAEIEFEMDCPTDLQVLADPLHFKNVLATVLDNAVKYSVSYAENGKGSNTNCVRGKNDCHNNGPDTENGTGKTKIHIRAKNIGKNTIIEVTDNGCGIAKEHLSHIFEKYYRVPTGDVHQVRGYGLGLHYAYKVIGLHGGSISARSRLGQGTTITIVIPHPDTETP